VSTTNTQFAVVCNNSSSGVDNPTVQIEDGINSFDGMGDQLPQFSQYWEAESVVQVTDVQGHLKQNMSFWKNVLHAPPPILQCIESGYRLSLKFAPLHISKGIISQQSSTVAL